MTKCPECHSPLDDFFIDYDPPAMWCPHCDARIPPERFFTKSTVNDLQFLIPEDKRDAFFSALGFERKPARRTSKLALAFVIGLPVFVVSLWIIIESPEQTLHVAVAVLCLVLFAWQIVGLYRDEAKPRYRKKKT